MLGGAQSLHTNGFDEALALPTEHAATLALRTQQVLMHEAGTTDTADPLGGSFAIEALTRELEERAWELIRRIDEIGGAVAAIEAGFVQGEIEESAFRWQQEIESRRARDRRGQPLRRRGRGRADRDPPARPGDRARRSAERTAAIRARRDSAAAEAAIAEVVRVAGTDENLLPPLREALRTRCTVGELCGALRSVWGTLRPVG